MESQNQVDQLLNDTDESKNLTQNNTAEVLEERQSLGQLFKQERLKRNLTYKDIQSLINVAPKILESLENDDFKSSASMSFTKGYIRSYAKFLNISEEVYLPLIEQYNLNDQTKLMANPLNPLEDDSFKKPIVLKIGIIVGLAILISLSIWWYMGYENAEVERNQVINDLSDTSTSTTYTPTTTTESLPSGEVLNISSSSLLPDPTNSNNATASGTVDNQTSATPAPASTSVQETQLSGETTAPASLEQSNLTLDNKLPAS